jgi:hypothetical protein
MNDLVRNYLVSFGITTAAHTLHTRHTPTRHRSTSTHGVREIHESPRARRLDSPAREHTGTSELRHYTHTCKASGQHAHRKAQAAAARTDERVLYTQTHTDATDE